MSELDYQIIIPSRGRVANMPRMLSLLPTAYVSVEECEVDDYVAVLPRERVIPHPKLSGIGPIWHWLLVNLPTRAIAFVSDDLQYVFCLVGRSYRRITDGPAITRIVENGVRLAEDLGVSLFSWGRSAAPLYFMANDPFTVTGVSMDAFIVVGRRIMVDPLTGSRCGDGDLSLQALLVDRVSLQDRRFYWNFGSTWEGKPGGQQGVRTADQDFDSARYLKRKWGQYVEVDQPKKINRILGWKDSGGATFAVRVKRHSNLASH